MGLVAVERRQAPADVGEADPLAAPAAPAAAGTVGIAIVAHHDDDHGTPAVGGDLDPPAADQAGDAVFDGVFHQRLEQQRRHRRVAGRRVEALRYRQLLREADLLDGEVGADQRQLLAQGDGAALDQAQAAAEEVGEHQRHPPRRRGVAPGERGDGVETVEQEVGVNLGPERPQLGLAGEHAHLERPALGRPRGLDRQRQVVTRRDQQVEEDAEGEEQRGGAPVAVRRPGQGGEELQGAHPGAAEEQPEGARQGGGDGQRQRRPQQVGRLRHPERRHPADVPRRQRDLRVDGDQRQPDGEGLGEGEAGGRREEEDHQPAERQPAGEIDPEPTAVGE